jgi:hypothetical protein
MTYGVTQHTTSPRHSLLSRYHKPSPYTCTCNFIYTHKRKSTLRQFSRHSWLTNITIFRSQTFNFNHIDKKNWKYRKKNHLQNSVRANIFHWSRFQGSRCHSIVFVNIRCTGLLQNRIRSKENVGKTSFISLNNGWPLLHGCLRNLQFSAALYKVTLWNSIKMLKKCWKYREKFIYALKCLRREIFYDNFCNEFLNQI